MTSCDGTPGSDYCLDLLVSPLDVIVEEARIPGREFIEAVFYGVTESDLFLEHYDIEAKPALYIVHPESALLWASDLGYHIAGVTYHTGALGEVIVPTDIAALTIVHECAHLISRSEPGHGPLWRSRFRSLMVDRYGPELGDIFDYAATHHEPHTEPTQEVPA